MDNLTKPAIVKAWENLSEYYQKTTQISTYDVHYGPLTYGEKKLKLIGDVKRKRVLEIGCGGGQNTIALARWGADVFGADPSQNQIKHARRLAGQCKVDAAFVTASAEDLTEVHRVLKRNSIFVLCLGHPYFHAVGFYLSEDPDEPEIRDYLSWPEVVTWNWECDTKSIQMWSYNRTLSQIINPLLERFILEEMVEQGIEDMAVMSEKEKADIPYLCTWNEKEYTVQRKLPSTLILRLRKP
ncbi:MAG: hypothetical protein AYK19_20475 [Theionarchaea archaeon DG-70-1]|nr:MAG: hypothetical protein AYK19_20475 [Theionarchaea archaeon DG-70-1]